MPGLIIDLVGSGKSTPDKFFGSFKSKEQLVSNTDESNLPVAGSYSYILGGEGIRPKVYIWNNISENWILSNDDKIASELKIQYGASVQNYNDLFDLPQEEVFVNQRRYVISNNQDYFLQKNGSWQPFDQVEIIDGFESSSKIAGGSALNSKILRHIQKKILDNDFLMNFYGEARYTENVNDDYSNLYEEFYNYGGQEERYATDFRIIRKDDGTYRFVVNKSGSNLDALDCQFNIADYNSVIGWFKSYRYRKFRCIELETEITQRNRRFQVFKIFPGDKYSTYYEASSWVFNYFRDIDPAKRIEKIIPNTTQYTAVLEDKNRHLVFKNPINFIIPVDVFSASDEIEADNESSGDINIIEGDNMTLNVASTQLKKVPQFGFFGLRFKSRNRAALLGQLKPA